ncbi:MAG: hypothetical protein D6816_13145 [Bacteroidetes bacterium]|nr:MAG: hypothetical protein D6816_13145 [Bacteroidota bacterium]
MADEPVVVTNFEPMKLGNNVEDKTRRTSCTPNSQGSQLGLLSSKVIVRCEGVKLNQSDSLRDSHEVQVKTIAWEAQARNFGKGVTSLA